MIEHSVFTSPMQGRRALLSGLGGLGLTAALARPAPAAKSNLAVVGKDGWLFPLWDAMSRYDQAAQRGVVQVVADAAGILKSAGIETVVALIPSKCRTYRQYLPDDVRLTPDIDKRYPAAVADLGRTVLVPDIDAAFRTARGSQQLYFKSDTHWMPAAAEVAATEVAKRVKERLRLPASGRPGNKLNPPTTLTMPAGDLARFVAPADRAKYGAEPYQIREAAAVGSAAALLEDDTTDVTIVGNSFMQPKFGFPTILSNQLERPVGLAWKPNNYGAYFTLLEYVKSQAFKKSRPKLLVWGHLEFDMQNQPNSSSFGQNAMPPQTFLTDLRQAVGA